MTCYRCGAEHDTEDCSDHTGPFALLARSAREEIRREERELVAEFLEERAQKYNDIGWGHSSQPLREAAREIRDGAHEGHTREEGE